MFIIQAVPAILVAIWLHFSATEKPENHPRLSAEERDYIIATRTVETTDESTLLQVFMRPVVWLLALIYFFWVMGIYALTLWLPTVIGDLTGQGSFLVGFLTAIPFLVGTAAMYLVTKRAVASGRSLGSFIALPIAISGTAMIVQHFVHFGAVFSFAMLVVAAGSIYAALALWWTWVMQIVPRNQAGASVGFVNLCGNFGGLVGPLLIGLVATAGNTASGFWIIGVGVIIAALIVKILDSRRTGPTVMQNCPGSTPMPTWNPLRSQPTVDLTGARHGRAHRHSPHHNPRRQMKDKRIALVTGAGAGIGAAIAEQLGQAGRPCGSHRPQSGERQRSRRPI